jgi:hypothetical protein
MTRAKGEADVVESGRLRAARMRGFWIGVALLTALVPAVVAANAKAAAPVLEFTSASAFPITFTADGGEVSAALAGFDTEVHCSGSHGEGMVTTPHSTASLYVFTGCETLGGSKGGQSCKSAGANPNEIKSGLIQADLVFIDQAKREVGMVLNPHGGTYLDFECGGESVKAIGSFLSPVGPINQPSASFTASMNRSGATQTPDQYEGPSGEKIAAIPTGERAGQPAATTGVELDFMIHTSAALTINAVTTAEVEAKQREEAAAKKRQEDEAAAKKRLEEEQAKARKALEHRRLVKALKQCRRLDSKHRRTRCEHRAKRKHRV